MILTKKAGQMYESNTELRNQYISKLFEGVTKQDIGTAIRLFRKLDENLDDYMAEKT